MGITSELRLLEIMEENFCSLLPLLDNKVDMNTLQELSNKIVLGLINHEIKVYETLIEDTRVIMKERADKRKEYSDIMDSYFNGLESGFKARINGYKSRITKLNETKIKLYEKIC